MGVRVAQVMEAIEKIAPKRIADPHDRIGLHLGDPASNIERMLTTLDVSEEVVDYAIEHGIGMIICHHPFVFNPLKDVREDMPQGRKIARLIRANIAVYSVHTNFDGCSGGINDILARKFGLGDIEILDDDRAEKLFKLVVFVPGEAIDRVREALFSAGAGHIGEYSHCGFVTKGVGSFRPLSGSNPYCGEVNQTTEAEEHRLETIVSEVLLNKAIKAMKVAHPYETPAYDVLQMNFGGTAIGLARIGKLRQPATLLEFARMVKQELAAERVSYCGDPRRLIKKVAVCGGAGHFLLNKAVMKGADVLVSSEFSNHHMIEALEQGLAIVESTHFATENVMPRALAEYLRGYAETSKWKIDRAAIMENDFSVDYMRTL